MQGTQHQRPRNNTGLDCHQQTGFSKSANVLFDPLRNVTQFS